MRSKILAASLAVVTIWTGLSATSAAQGASTTASQVQAMAPGNGRIDVWNWNMTGAGSDPEAVNNGGHEDALAPVINQLNALGASARPDVITLQEVCENQANHLATYLDSIQYKVNWRPVRGQSRCASRAPGAGQQLGDLVAVPKAYNPAVANYDVDTTTPADQPVGVGMTCLSFTKSRFVVACSTQLEGDEDQRRAQTYRMLQDQIKPWVDLGYGVVLAGDFNTTPDKSPMDNMYDETVPGARGRLLEASMTCGTCRDGAWTHDSRGSLGYRKIDYVFYSKNLFARSSFQVDLDLKAKYSYHRFYKASSTFK